jgi:hypothetical protein
MCLCRVVSAALLFGAVNVSVGKCPSTPVVTATVVISSCAAATFAPGNASYGPSSADPGRLDLERESFSGTVMSAVVRSARFTGDRSYEHRMDAAELWRKGASATLFVARPVDGVCPDKLPVEIAVQTARKCCDVLPLRGQCLIPDSIIPVTILSGER